MLCMLLATAGFSAFDTTPSHPGSIAHSQPLALLRNGFAQRAAHPKKSFWNKLLDEDFIWLHMSSNWKFIVHTSSRFKNLWTRDLSCQRWSSTGDTSSKSWFGEWFSLWPSKASVPTLGCWTMVRNMGPKPNNNLININYINKYFADLCLQAQYDLKIGQEPWAFSACLTQVVERSRSPANDVDSLQNFKSVLNHSQSLDSQGTVGESYSNSAKHCMQAFFHPLKPYCSGSERLRGWPFWKVLAL